MVEGTAMKRRGILAAAGAVVAGIVAKQAGQPVSAATGGTQGTPLIVGANYANGTANMGTQPTMVFNGLSTTGSYYAADAFVAASQSGSGVQGYAFTNGVGVAGYNIGGTASNASGVYGSAGSGIGVYGVSASSSGGGVGVQGAGNQDNTFNTTGFPIGVRGSVQDTGYGVYGKAGNGFGVYGIADGGIGVNGFSTGDIGVRGEIPPNSPAANTVAVKGVNQSTGAGGIGVQGQSTTGLGGSLQGGLAPLRLVPAASGTGAPATGAHAAGELFVDAAGLLFYCRAGGTPGTWTRLDTTPASVPFFTTLPTPERFVDTRTNLGGVQGPVPANTTHTFLMTGRNGQSGNPALQIPDRATAIVGNLTVVGAAGIPLGSSSPSGQPAHSQRYPTLITARPRPRGRSPTHSLWALRGTAM